jgi:hypothetical protein
VYAFEMRKATRWQDRIIAQQDTGCWLWQGRVEPGGHGQFTRDGRTLRAHRVAWEETHGPVPPGSIVSHACEVPSCCNPDHLFLITMSDLKKSGAVPWRERIAKQSGGCWLWTGSVNADGYAQVRRDGRTWPVHRLVWEEANGPIPDGKYVCHVCDTPPCCNPDHLFLGSQQANVTDMIEKGRFKGGSYVNALKTHCKRGHEFTADNTLLYRGMRTCRQCNKDRSLARYYEKKKT